MRKGLHAIGFLLTSSLLLLSGTRAQTNLPVCTDGDFFFCRGDRLFTTFFLIQFDRDLTELSDAVLNNFYSSIDTAYTIATGTVCDSCVRSVLPLTPNVVYPFRDGPTLPPPGTRLLQKTQQAQQDEGNDSSKEPQQQERSLQVTATAVSTDYFVVQLDILFQFDVLQCPQLVTNPTAFDTSRPVSTTEQAFEFSTTCTPLGFYDDISGTCCCSCTPATPNQVSRDDFKRSMEVALGSTIPVVLELQPNPQAVCSPTWQSFSGTVYICLDWQLDPSRVQQFFQIIINLYNALTIRNCVQTRLVSLTGTPAFGTDCSGETTCYAVEVVFEAGEGSVPSAPIIPPPSQRPPGFVIPCVGFSCPSTNPLPDLFGGNRRRTEQEQDEEEETFLDEVEDLLDLSFDETEPLAWPFNDGMDVQPHDRRMLDNSYMADECICPVGGITGDYPPTFAPPTLYDFVRTLNPILEQAGSGGIVFIASSSFGQKISIDPICPIYPPGYPGSPYPPGYKGKGYKGKGYYPHPGYHRYKGKGYYPHPGHHRYGGDRYKGKGYYKGYKGKGKGRGFYYPTMTKAYKGYKGKGFSHDDDHYYPPKNVFQGMNDGRLWNRFMGRRRNRRRTA